MKTKNERRKYKRLPLTYSVEIIKPKKIKKAKTRDLSIKGICLVAPVSFKENSLLKMKIQLDPEKNLSLDIQGKVVWKIKRAKKEFHHGVLITKIKPEAYDMFRKFIATKLIELLLE